MNQANERHFATEHLLADLKGRAISSGAVTVLAQAARFVLNLFSIVILARLLTPEDFGLVAMVSAVIGFVRVFKDAGLSTATVQREDITHAQVSNLFWINVGVSGVIVLGLAAASPLLARFYGEPRLVGIMLALCLTFHVSASTGQHMALLSRQMRFKTIALIDVGSSLVGLVVAIVMSLLHCGYWSLVAMSFTAAAVAFILTWSTSGWRPQLPRRHSGTASLVGFGFNVTAASFIFAISRGIDSLLIGRMYGADALGLYTRASALLARPLEQFIAPVDAVFVPALSRLQAQSVRYRRVFLLVYETIALAGSLFTGLLLGLAYPLTLVVLGPKWQGAATIFAGLAAVALFMPLCSACSWLMTSQGRGRDSLICSMIVSAATVIAFAAGLPFGPSGVAVAYSTAGLLIHIPTMYYLAGRHGPVRTSDLWMSTVPYVPVWAVVSIASWFIGVHLLHATAPIQLIVGSGAGLISGGLVIAASARARAVVVNGIAVLRALRGFRGVPYGKPTTAV